MGASWRTGGIAAILVAAAWASTARAGSSTTMAVNLAWDERNSTEYDESSFQVADLNTVAQENYVRVWDGLINYWEVRLTDPYPVSIPGGSVLTSVVVTVQYEMEAGSWNGTLPVEARKGSGASSIWLGTDMSMPEHITPTQETWDITALVNSELDPLDTLNLLRIRMINNDQNGPGINVLWTYALVDVAFNAAPYRPSFTSPGVDEPDVSRNPTLAADAYGHLEALSHKDSDWEVYDDASLAAGNRVAYSLADATDKESIGVAQANVTFENSLNLKTALLPNTEYWARVRYRDANDLVSDWSVPRHFTTGVGLPPTEPVVADPGSPTSRRPSLTASAYSDPEGDAHASSDWEVFEDVGLAMRVVSSLDNTSDLASITIDDGPGVAFENALAGTTSLAPDTDYWVQVAYRDEYGAASTSAAVGFTTAANMDPDVPSITSPSGAGVSRLPTITASAYNDQDFDLHASSDWEVFDAATFTPSDLVASSMVDTANLATIDMNGGAMVFQGSLAGRSSLAPLTDYWVRVTCRDAYGGEATSAEVQFTTVANAPPAQPVITSPSADGVNVPLNPVMAADAYSDPDGDAHSATYWEVHDNPTLTSLVAAGGNPAVNLTSIVISTANVVFSGSLAGSTSLAPSTDYWVVVTYRDGQGADSAPSAAVHFKTGDYPVGEEWPFFGSGCSPGPGRRQLRSSTAAFGGTCLALWLCAAVLFRRRRVSL